MESQFIGRKTRKSLSNNFVLIAILNFRFHGLLALANDRTDNINKPSLLHNDQNKEISICQTNECVSAGYETERNMNYDVEPCADFYEFVCGKFQIKQQIAEDDYMINTGNQTVEKELKDLRRLIENITIPNDEKPFELVHRFYSNCLNLDYKNDREINKIREYINLIGGWPVLHRVFYQYNFDVAKMISYFYHIGLSPNYLFKISMELDPLKRDSYILAIDKPDLEFSNEIFLENFWDNHRIDNYFNYMRKIAKLFGASEDYINLHLYKSMQFEQKLFNYTLAEEKRSAFNSSYIRMYIGELHLRTPSINWLRLLNNFLNEDILVSKNHFVLVKVPEYLINLSKLIRDTPNDVVMNYLLWKVIAECAPFITGELRELHFEYKAAITGQVHRKRLWRECLETTITYFPAVISELYRIPEYKLFALSAVEVYHQISDSLETNIDKTTWMNENDKNRAKAKVKSLNYHIEEWNSIRETQLKEFYSDLRIYSNSYFDSVLSIFRKNRQSFVSLFSQRVSHTNNWRSFLNAPFYHALYIHEKNSINIPIGILNRLTAERALPYYTKFAGIGMLIGHELSHIFDRKGRQFNQYDDELHNWCDYECDKHFLKRDQCVIDQYNDFMLNISTNAVGYIMQDENIADVDSINIVYESYMKHLHHYVEDPQLPNLRYTNKQMFWIWYGRMQCTQYRPEAYRHFVKNGISADPKFRVNNPLRNSYYFAKDFNCNVCDYMFLDDKEKCVV